MSTDTPTSRTFATIERDDGSMRLVLAGAWTVDNAGAIERAVGDIKQKLAGHRFDVQAKQISKLDTSGALLLKKLLPDGHAPRGLTKSQRALIDFLPAADSEAIPQPPPKRGVIAQLGCRTVDGLKFLRRIFTFIGRVAVCILHNFRHPRHFRFPTIVRQIQQTGIAALLIVSLLAVLISMVITYQGAIQLRKFGAAIFTIDLTVIALLREMGVLVTAIMVAGRSGSSFAAELGVMNLREEVNALRTIGMDPIEVLVVPRVIALMIALPLLTFVADIVGLAGGGLISRTLLGVGAHEYFSRVHSTVTGTMVFVGLIKAPVFAFVISVIGCYQGLNVSGSAESIGKMTTLAVVQSIFIVIMADALFSLVFAQVGI